MGAAVSPAIGAYLLTGEDMHFPTWQHNIRPRQQLLLGGSRLSLKGEVRLYI